MTQALIAAGGYGTKISVEHNPLQSKPLMAHEGQPFLGWLVDALKEGGIEDFVIATNNHCDQAISDFLSTKDIAYKTVVAQGGHRAVPYRSREMLRERFLFACGHHPLSVAHVRALLDKALVHESVVTAYDNAVHPMGDPQRFIVDDANSEHPEYRRVDTDAIPREHFYVQDPYIVPMKLVAATKADNFGHRFTHYHYRDWARGGSLGVAGADMPKEFDYDHELIQAGEFVGRMLAQRYFERNSVAGSLSQSATG